jgi:PIN domain nuclease of toxin-antitoxin system
MLAARGRIAPRQLPESCWRDWLRAGWEEFHADPADRFIVATALALGATLVTADQAILGWSGPLRRQSAGT